MKITLYTTGCPKCHVLESKLEDANLEYETVTDINIMQEKGFMAAPMLEVDGAVLDFGKAVKWINGMEGE